MDIIILILLNCFENYGYHGFLVDVNLDIDLVDMDVDIIAGPHSYLRDIQKTDSTCASSFDHHSLY